MWGCLLVQGAQGAMEEMLRGFWLATGAKPIGICVVGALMIARKVAMSGSGYARRRPRELRRG